MVSEHCKSTPWKPELLSDLANVGWCSPRTLYHTQLSQSAPETQPFQLLRGPRLEFRITSVPVQNYTRGLGSLELQKPTITRASEANNHLWFKRQRATALRSAIPPLHATQRSATFPHTTLRPCSIAEELQPTVYESSGNTLYGFMIPCGSSRLFICRISFISTLSLQCAPRFLLLKPQPSSAETAPPAEVT